MASKPKSFVWQHFDKVEGSGCKCIHCEAVLKYAAGCTSTMAKHLWAKHSITDRAKLSGALKMKEELAEEKPRLVCSASSPSLGTPTIASFYGAAKPSEQITSIVVEMIYADLLPVSTVEHLGFRKLLKFLAPNYVVPTRRTVQARLKAKFDEMKDMAIRHLSSDAVEFLSLTTDLWTSIAQDGYIGVTAHFIDLEWEMKSIILTVEEMDERHTAANISERLKAIADEWKITKKVGAVVHDNASNMLLAAKLLRESSKWDHQNCVGHTLQLSIEAGLAVTAISHLLAKARKLVGHFSHSTLATTQLHRVQERNKRLQRSLVRDVATRWNSSYLMLDRLVAEKASVSTVLEDETFTSARDCSSLKLTGTQWDLAEELAKALKPLHAATTALSLEQNSSISTVMPIISGILQHMEKSDSDSHAVCCFKRQVTADLQARFPSTGKGMDCSVNVTWLAAAIDPRFKELKFLKEKMRGYVWTAIEDRVKAISQKKATEKKASEPCASLEAALPQLAPTSVDAIEPPPAKVAKPASHDMDVMAFLLGETAASNMQTQASLSEVERFRAEPPVAISTNILQWWRVNKDCFPSLARVARQLLSTPATSTPSERLFSTAGIACNRKRASLMPENLNMVVFLNKNKSFLESLL